MIQISNELKNKLNTSTSIKIKNKIVVGTTEYDSSIIKTYPKLSHKNSSVFGGFPSKTCSFEIYNHNNNIDFENKEIKLYKGIEVSGSIEWILQGIFIPRAKDIETNITSKTISFSNVQDKTQLFDVSYKSDLSWDNNVTHTGLEIIQEICTKLSIDLSSNTFNLSSYSFKQPNFAENITCREVISRFAEIAGSIAFINREGKLEIKAPTNTSSTIERSRYIKLTKENEVSFNTLVLGKDGINDDIVYPETIATDRVEYKILDNPFVDLYREDMIEDISANIIGKSYIPFTLNNFVDGFCFDLNDVISVKDRNGNALNLTILNYETANRISAIVSAETMGTMTTDYNLSGSSKNELWKVKLNVDHNNQSITALAKRTTDNETNISQLKITSENITSRVQTTEDNISDLENANETLSGRINDKVNKDELNEIINTVKTTILEQTSESFTMWFEETGLQGTLDTMQNELDDATENSNTLKEYIHFEGAEITLGRSDSQTKLVIKNDRISFMTGDTESAYISENTLSITDSTILNKMQIGHWETKEDENGNLNVKWIGDNS